MRSPRAKRPKCPQCKGDGRIVLQRRVGLIGLIERKVVVCSLCHGTGRMSHAQVTSAS